MQVLSKEEEIKRCQDTVTRLILAFRGLDQHDRSGRSALEAELEEATGQGRWGLYVKRPSAMIEYYRQATLDEKLNTTDLTLTKQPTKSKTL